MDINKFAAEKLKKLRMMKNLTQEELAEELEITQQQIARYENGLRQFKQEFLFKLANYFNVSINDFFPPLNFDNAEIIDISYDRVQIPVLGTIKAGTPIEAQEDILDYVDIPKEWTKGDKKFFALRISGDSMFPKYKENDIVVFEQTEDYSIANKKDCAVMVNGDDATFKNIAINEESIMLIPLNANNTDGYIAKTYFADEIVSLPVKIIGIAREKREKLD